MTHRYTSPDVACPTCGAGQGEKCRGSDYSGRSNRAVSYHFDRREAARALNRDDTKNRQEVEMPAITETVNPVEESANYTEAYLFDNGTIGLHVETTTPEPVDATYTLEQAEALHRALGHLLYLANQEA